MTVYRSLPRANTSVREGLTISSALIKGVIVGLLIWAPLSLQAVGTGIPECRHPSNASGLTGKVTPAAVDSGTTQLFWAFAQGFFTGYYPLSATCQVISQNTYLFTEDAYINDVSASLVDPQTVYAAGRGTLYKSTDGGLTWNLRVGGLPDADGAYDGFDSSNYNHRADFYCLFSRAEYGESFDTVWVGTEYGPFWTTAGGDTFALRATGMSFDVETGNNKPAVYDILGHPANAQTLWAATIDGVYMTRNANRWKSASAGLPPGEGTDWASNPVYALAYESTDSLLFVSSSKGVFYGSIRPLGTSPTSDVIASWKPLGGEVTLDSILFANEDTLKLLVNNATSQGMTISAGQNITVIDTTTGLYWMTLVDESADGLFALLTDSRIFYYPQGTSPPAVDYSGLTLTDLLTYGYSQMTGPAIYVETVGDTTTVWLGTDGSGLYSYQLIGAIKDRYFTSQETISSSHDSVSIYKIARKGDDYYFATAQGLFRATDPHGEWSRVTGYIMNVDNSDSLAADTRTVAFGPDDYVFTGGYFGGFLRSDNGLDFEPSNFGTMHHNGTLNQLNLFANEFNSATPADPGKGIFETVQEWWGELPPPTSTEDIDGDSLVTVLFLDIDDQFYLDTGDGTYINGYYDGINEYSILAFVSSNQREMFYLDTDPQWINRGGPAACNQVFNLINWNQDFQEEIWLREGMASFGQNVAGYSMATGTITFPLMNDLVSWGDYNRDVEHLYSFLLVQYLYEQVFPNDSTVSPVVHQIAEVATSPYHGVEGLGRLIYEKNTGGTSSPEVDYTPVFASFFDDFVLAGALDISDPDFYGGKYGFANLNTKIAATYYNWYYPPANPVSKPPFSWNISFWGGRAIQVSDVLFFNNAYPIVDLFVNGDDRNRLSFYLLFTFTGDFQPEMPGDSVVVIQIPTDSVTQKGGVTLPDSLQLGNGSTPPNLMRLLTICSSDSGDAPSCYVFSDDATPPQYLYQSVSQNPIDDRYLDIYTFSGDRIFPDGGQLYRVDDIGLTELEGPKVDISGGEASDTGADTLVTLDQNVFYSNPGASDFVYHIAYHLEKINFPADLHFLAYGEDVTGNNKSSDTLDVTIDFIQSQVGGFLYHAQSTASLFVPPLALKEDAYIMLSASQSPSGIPQEVAARTIAAPNDDSHYAVGPIVSAGSAGLKLTAPVELEIPFNPSLAAGGEVGVYRAEGNSWVYIGGTLDSESGCLKTYSWEFGQFQVFTGPPGDMQPEMPYSFRLEQNYPNPFNPSTRIQFELTRTQQVKVDVYNVLGMRVARLADGTFEAGKHVLPWTPKNISSGVYFLRLEADEGILYSKLMLLK